MMIWDTSHNFCRYLQTRYYCFYRWHHNVFDDRLTDIWVTNLPNISSNIFVDQGQFSDPDLSAAHIKGKMSKLLINHMTLVHIFNIKAAFIVVYIFLVIFFFQTTSHWYTTKQIHYYKNMPCFLSIYVSNWRIH